MIARPLSLTPPSQLARSLLSIHPEGTNVAAAYNNQGVTEFGKGYLDDAIADFARGVNRNPKFVDAFQEPRPRVQDARRR